jgi:hypothetical protein
MEEKKTFGQKIKGHFGRHKGKYITGGICLGVGTTIGILYGDKVKNQVRLINLNIGKDNSIVNNITNVTNVVRRGHAGNIVRCVETGEIFASQNRAADLLDISRTALSQHLKGAKDDVNGMHFEKVGNFNSQK